MNDCRFRTTGIWSMGRYIFGVSMIALLPFVNVSAEALSPIQSLRNDTLVTMQSAVITTRDLLERLELMPWPGKEHKARADSIRRKALSALVAEKLLAAEFDRSGISESAEVQRLRKGLQNVLLRDLLYRTEILGKVSVSDEETRSALRRAQEIRRIVIFEVGSEFEGSVLSRRLRQLQGSDSLIRAYRDGLVLRSEQKDISFGSSDRSIEDVVYTLRTGEVSEPVRIPTERWYVIVLMATKKDPEWTANPADWRRRVERIVRRRKEVERAHDFYYNFLSGYHAKADSIRFEAFARALERRWMADRNGPNRLDTFQVTSGLVDLLGGDLADVIDSPLVRLERDVLSVGDILELLRYEQFTIEAPDRLRLRIELNERIKSMVANVLLEREARRRGLHRRNGFRREMRVWDDYWRSRRLYDTILDTIRVTDDDVMHFIRRNMDLFGGRFEVNVREVLTASDNEARAVLSEMAQGRTMADIARERTLRDAWKARGGESGYFMVKDHPIIGAGALVAGLGEVQGPVRTPDGASVFISLGKRTTADGSPVGRFIEEMRARLSDEKRHDILARYVRSLARQEGVHINGEALSNVKITSINMFTRRYIGFGGTMTAVPMLSSQWDWLTDLGSDIEYVP